MSAVLQPGRWSRPQSYPDPRWGAGVTAAPHVHCTVCWKAQEGMQNSVRVYNGMHIVSTKTGGIHQSYFRYIYSSVDWYQMLLNLLSVNVLLDMFLI